MRTQSHPVVPMNSDFEELLRIFNANEVKYLVVGGYAVMPLANPENAAKVWRALVDFGAPLAGLGPDDFAHEGFFYPIGQPPVRVDILMSIDGVTFEEAWPNRKQSHLGAQTAWFIGREDLLKNKRTTSRHIDLDDAA